MDNRAHTTPIPIYIMFIGVLLYTTVVVAVEYGVVTGVVTLVGGLLITIAIAIAATIITAWIAYIAGFHRQDRLSGWRVALAFLLMPVGVFAVPVVNYLGMNLITPFVPTAVAAAIHEERNQSRRGQARLSDFKGG